MKHDISMRLDNPNVHHQGAPTPSTGELMRRRQVNISSKMRDEVENWASVFRGVLILGLGRSDDRGDPRVLDAEFVEQGMSQMKRDRRDLYDFLATRHLPHPDYRDHQHDKNCAKHHDVAEVTFRSYCVRAYDVLHSNLANIDHKKLTRLISLN